MNDLELFRHEALKFKAENRIIEAARLFVNTPAPEHQQALTEAVQALERLEAIQSA